MRVPRRQWDNSFFSSVSGSLTGRITYDNGKLNEAINNLYDSLRRRFDMNDVVAALSVDLLIADFWRQSEAIKQEKQALGSERWPFSRRGFSGSCGDVSQGSEPCPAELGVRFRDSQNTENEIPTSRKTKNRKQNTRRINSSAACQGKTFTSTPPLYLLHEVLALLCLEVVTVVAGRV